MAQNAALQDALNNFKNALTQRLTTLETQNFDENGKHVGNLRVEGQIIVTGDVKANQP